MIQTRDSLIASFDRLYEIPTNRPNSDKIFEREGSRGVGLGGILAKVRGRREEEGAKDGEGGD